MATESQANRRMPNATSTTSWWRTQPHELDEFRSSDTVPEIVDVAIIGAGLAGACTAYHILSGEGVQQPANAPTVAIFEARQACSGATGRNGGHTKLSPLIIANFAQRHGPAAGLHLALFIKDLLREMRACAESIAISTTEANGNGQECIVTRSLAEECEMLATRSWDIFLDEEQAKDVEARWTKAVDDMREVAISQGRVEDLNWFGEVQFLKGKYVENITSVRGAKAATSCPALSLWPYKFVIGVLQHVLELGAKLYTLTPVTRLERVNKGGSPSAAFPTSQKGLTALHTSRGTTLARRVVFATNAYVSALLPQYETTIIPGRGTACRIVRKTYSSAAGNDAQNSFQSPVPEYSQFTNTYNIHGGPASREYFNPRPDGSVILGGGQPLYRANKPIWYGMVDDGTLIPEVKEHWFEGYMGRHFRGWAADGSEEKVDRIWTGIMAYTEDAWPHVGLVPEETDHFILAGFNGAGMVSIFLVARGIAKMIQDGVPFEETGIPPIFKTIPERFTNLVPNPPIT